MDVNGIDPLFGCTRRIELGVAVVVAINRNRADLLSHLVALVFTDSIGTPVLTRFHDCCTAQVQWIFTVISTGVGGAREGKQVSDAIEPVKCTQPVIEPIGVGRGIPNADLVEVMTVRVFENSVILAAHGGNDIFGSWAFNPRHKSLTRVD